MAAALPHKPETVDDRRSKGGRIEGDFTASRTFIFSLFSGRPRCAAGETVECAGTWTRRRCSVSRACSMRSRLSFTTHGAHRD